MFEEYKKVLDSCLSCESYLIFDELEQSIILGKNINKLQGIASLTKLMTCIVVCDLVEQYKLNYEELILIPSLTAVQVKGTTSNLQAGGNYTCLQLLYGCLLPSGNDSATVLAESFGSLLYIEKKCLKSFQTLTTTLIDVQNQNSVIQNCSTLLFVEKMNQKAKEIELQSTLFSSPHGLLDQNNYSTAQDLLKITLKFLTYPLLALISSQKEYFFQYLDKNNNLQQQNFQNTNKLLEISNFLGIKTGYTNKAKGCLISRYKELNSVFYEKFQFIIIILASQDQETRFTDTLNIINKIRESRYSYYKIPYLELNIKSNLLNKKSSQN